MAERSTSARAADVVRDFRAGDVRPRVVCQGGDVVRRFTWVRKCASFEEEARADGAFWALLSPDERVQALEDLRREAWKVTGERLGRGGWAWTCPPHRAPARCGQAPRLMTHADRGDVAFADAHARRAEWSEARTAPRG